MPEDAIGELARSFAGEGDRQDLGGVVHRGEQLEEALDEEAGLAGSGGSFDDEGALNIEGALTFGVVGGENRRGQQLGDRRRKQQQVSHTQQPPRSGPLRRWPSTWSGRDGRECAERSTGRSSGRP